MSDVLKQKKILVTRPVEQAEILCTLIEEQGGEAIKMPVIDIRPAHNNKESQKLLAALDKYQVGIFVSRNAVKHALILLNHDINALKHLKIVATGPATAAILQKNGITNIIHAGTYAESEALLELPELQSSEITGSNIIIFRGIGGRELLAETLRARGAKVDYAEVYERIPVQYTKQELDAVWSRHKPDYIVATSSESLQNLFDMLSSEQRDIMLDTNIVVFGKRMSELAVRLGFRKPPIIAQAMSDNGLLQAIMHQSGEKSS
jgi:uroporphyrinogen-III synthase